MHIHLRQADMLKAVLPHTVKQCSRAIVMPNTVPPVLTVEDLVNYRSSIIENLTNGDQFEPLMTFKVAPSTTPEEVKKLKEAGATAGKLYPDGVTTNSEDGVNDFKALYPVYDEMQNQNLVLCLHGEMPGEFSLDRETKFLETLKDIAGKFSKLKIVLEHCTTEAAIECVKALPENVAASITLHHLYLTLDDIIGGSLNPHAFCKPVAKFPSDREALVSAATSGNPKFFLGSDSAPHTVASKECACGAAGIYTAPVLLPALCQLFEARDRLDNFEPFVAEFGAKFYGLPLNKGSVKLVKKEWTVPEEYEGVKPFLAGEKLSWQLA